MNYLEEKWWAAFEDDGILFEKLCRKLLESMTHIPIEHTKRTRDGGRDLIGKAPVLQDDYYIIWGECKYHSQKLSMQKVSSTLVMAYLNDVDFLFFFSYSPVNSEFERHITDFCGKAKIRHYTYDDVRLEALLLQYQDEPWFDEFFPKFPKHGSYVSPTGIKVTTHLKRNSAEQSNSYANQEFSLNEAFQYQIYITNQDVQDFCDVTVSLEKGPELKFVEIVDVPSPKKYTRKIRIAPGSTALVSYKMRIIRYAPMISIPPISITGEGLHYPLRKNLQVSWLAEVPLIGGHYAAFLQSIEKRLIGRTSGTLLHIYGRSGCGKSRLSSEATHIFDKHQYTVITFDCETQNVDIAFISRAIVSHVEHLPDCFESIGSKEASQGSKGYRDKMAYRILYDEKYSIHNHEAEVRRYLTWLLRQTKVMIALDNIQVLQNSTMGFLQELLRETFRQPSKATILCCVNLDHLYSESLAEKLQNQLLVWSAKYPQDCLGLECEDFNADTAKLYLKQCIQPLAAQEQYLYDQTFSKIIDHIGTNPFALQQTLLLLRQKNVIALTNRSNFYFSDINHFGEVLNTLARSIKGLLADRECELFSKLTPCEQAQCRQLFSLLVFFQKLPQDLCHRVIGNASLVEHLKQLGFIRIYDDRQIVFYHNYFFLYFHSNEQYKYLEPAFAQDVICGVRALRLENELFAPYFILCHLQALLTPELYLDSAAYLLSGQIPDAFLSEYCEIMLRAIETGVFHAAPEKELRLCQRLCDYVSDSKGVKSGLKYYETLYTRLIADYSAYRSVPKRFFRFVKRYADNLNQCYRSDDTLQILKTTEGLMDKFDLSREMELYIRALIENRKSVPYKDIGKWETALQCIDRSIELAQEINDYSALISGYQDKGYLYYRSHEDNAHLCENWLKAFHIYEAHQEDGLSMKNRVSSHIHGLLADIARGAEQAAVKKYAALIEMIDHTGMKSYELKIRLALCLYFTAKHSYPRNFVQLLEEAKDQCVFYSYDREYYKCFYLEAIKARRDSRVSQSIDLYQLAMESILTNCQDARIFTKYTVQLLDILVQLRNAAGKEQLKHYRKVLKRFSPSEEICSILEGSDAAFSAYYENYIPQTPLRDVREKLGYPAV